MAHFAKIEDGIVTNVVVVDNEHEANGQEFLNSIGLDGTWIQTSYNANIRGKFAAIGDFYNESKDRFEPEVPPVKPHDSWVWNDQAYRYEAPVPHPEIDEENPVSYTWDEATLDWVVFEPTDAEA